MVKEQQSQSLPALEQRREELQQLHRRRKSWKEAFEAKAGTGTLDDDLKIARAIGTANTVIDRYHSKLALTSAQVYQQELTHRSETLERLREQTTLGNFPQAALEKREEEHTLFMQEATADPLIQQGISLLQEQTPPSPVPAPESGTTDKEGELEQAVFSVDRQRRTVILRHQGQERRLRFDFDEPIGTSVFFHFLEHSGEEVSPQEIREIMGQAGSESRASGAVISGLRKKIGDTSGEPTIIQRIGTKKAARYRLNARVEFIEAKEDETGDEGSTSLPQPREIPTVLSSRQEALHQLIENPESTLGDIIATLGPARNGRPLTKQQALWALNRTTALLYQRQGKGILTEKEQQMWDAIKEFTGSVTDHTAYTNFRERLAVRFKGNTVFQNRPERSNSPAEGAPSEESVPTPEENMEQQTAAIETAAPEKTITPFEAATLCTILEKYKNVPIVLDDTTQFTLSLGQDFDDLSEHFYEQLDQQPIQPTHQPGSNREVHRQRLSILKKMEGLFANGDIEEVMSQHDEKVQELLIWMYTKNLDDMDGYLYAFLQSMVERDMIYTKKEHRENLAEWHAPSEMIARRKARESALQEELIDTEEPVQTPDIPEEVPTETEAVAPAPVVLPPGEEVVLGTPEQQVSAIEKRYPEIREQLQEELRKIQEQVKLFPSNEYQLSSSMNIHARLVNRIITSLKVKPAGEYKGRPVYDAVGAVIIRFAFDERLHSNKKNLLPREADSLKQIADEVYQQWLAEQENQNK